MSYNDVMEVRQINKKLICSNKIIDSVKKYEPIQLKLFYGMLYKFKESVNLQNIDKDEEMVIDLKEIKKISGKQHCTEYYLKSMIDNMPKEVKFINKNEYGFVSVFKYVKYDFEEESLKFILNDFFADLLTETLETYSIIEFKDLTMLRAKYSQRLYELARRYIKQGEYLMKIDYFKEYFEVPTSYRICHLDQKILKPSIKDLNKNTSIICKAEKKKKGRNVTHILFKFRKDDQN